VTQRKVPAAEAESKPAAKKAPAAKVPAAKAEANKVLLITQVKSQIGYARTQRSVLKGLGLGRIGRTVTRPDHPAIRGMVAKIPHLLSVEEVKV
jgi:large subunit ribosomal protein L30